MQVGTNKDQGLYNKPSAAVHPGALAAGTLPQYNISHSSQSGILKYSPVWLIVTLYNHTVPNYTLYSESSRQEINNFR